MNKIEIQLNNNEILKLSQSESDKIRYGVSLELIDSDGNVTRELIDESDFVMLINYYRFIKDNDIKDEFINKKGLNDKEDYELVF